MFNQGSISSKIKAPNGSFNLQSSARGVHFSGQEELGPQTVSDPTRDSISIIEQSLKKMRICRHSPTSNHSLKHKINYYTYKVNKKITNIQK